MVGSPGHPPLPGRDGQEPVRLPGSRSHGASVPSPAPRKARNSRSPLPIALPPPEPHPRHTSVHLRVLLPVARQAGKHAENRGDVAKRCLELGTMLGDLAPHLLAVGLAGGNLAVQAGDEEFCVGPVLGASAFGQPLRGFPQRRCFQRSGEEGELGGEVPVRDGGLGWVRILAGIRPPLLRCRCRWQGRNRSGCVARPRVPVPVAGHRFGCGITASRVSAAEIPVVSGIPLAPGTTWIFDAFLPRSTGLRPVSDPPLSPECSPHRGSPHSSPARPPLRADPLSPGAAQSPGAAHRILPFRPTPMNPSMRCRHTHPERNELHPRKTP